MSSVLLRIPIADDLDIVREGLRRSPSSRAGCEVCAEAANGREAVQKARQFHPHSAVLDLIVPELNGVEATRQIGKIQPRIEVIVLMMHRRTTSRK